MINYSEALQKLTAGIKLLTTETISIAQAYQRVLAETIISPVAFPEFDNSAMDGFAVRAHETLDCSPEKPKHFSVVATVLAGDGPSQDFSSPNTACEITTGAMMPKGYDSVVPIENVIQDENKSNTILLQQPLTLHQNVRFAGEDFAINDVVLAKGTALNPGHVMALTALGVHELNVYRLPRIAIINTGNELVNARQAALQAGQIYNSNGPYLHTFLQSLGMPAQWMYCIEDDPKKFQETLQSLLALAQPPDLIISSGAVSKGKKDFIPEVLQGLQAEILFHKVAIRPGKPILAAKIAQTTYFGLPGNPLATAAGFRFFVYPWLRKMQSMPDETPSYGRLQHATTKKVALQLFSLATCAPTASGENALSLIADQQSFKVKPLTEANAWVILESSRHEWEAGEPLAFYPLYFPFS